MSDMVELPGYNQACAQGEGIVKRTDYFFIQVSQDDRRRVMAIRETFGVRRASGLIDWSDKVAPLRAV